jgi:selenocysteine lyase/cysteine desulfurase
MENYFSKFRKKIIGIHHKINTQKGRSKNLIYADWTASGRMYQPIEDNIQKNFLPFVANTHTDTNYTGSKMTYAYKKAKEIIKNHVGANDGDILISSNSGMTGMINKFQRILGLKIHESFRGKIHLQDDKRPIVFITHMEHHSNQTTWLETIAEVIVVPPNEKGLVCLVNFKKAINKYKNRKIKIVSITACSNVTGIITPYMDIAEIIHENKGFCFVDFACSAPYTNINMHENDKKGRFLDAIFFSPHKFLGGPGATGILIFNHKLYSNSIPDNPGGGTVEWTNPWGGHKYIDSIEDREDGGTPAFLQTIRAAMSIKLKEKMGVNNMKKREKEIIDLIWPRLKKIPNLHLLADQHKERLTIFSFYIDNLHYNLGVKMLNDYYGIQSRGGCSCAGTYGHYLLNVNKDHSEEITFQINNGNFSLKPGWIRISIHPTDSNQDIKYILNAIEKLAIKHKLWAKDYEINIAKSYIKNNKYNDSIEKSVNGYFSEYLF